MAEDIKVEVEKLEQKFYGGIAPPSQQYGAAGLVSQINRRSVDQKTFTALNLVKKERGDNDSLYGPGNATSVGNNIDTGTGAGAVSTNAVEDSQQKLFLLPAGRTTVSAPNSFADYPTRGLDHHAGELDDIVVGEEEAEFIDDFKAFTPSFSAGDLPTMLMDEMGSDLYLPPSTTDIKEMMLDPPGLSTRLLKDLQRNRKVFRATHVTMAKYAYTKLNVPVMFCYPVVGEHNMIEKYEWLCTSTVANKLRSFEMTGFTQEVEDSLAKDFNIGYSKRNVRDLRPVGYSVQMVTGPDGIELPKPWEPVLHMSSDQAGMYYSKLLDALYRIEFGSRYSGRKFRKFANVQRDGSVRPPTPLQFYDQIAEEILPRALYLGRARARGSVKDYNLQLVCAYLLYRVGRENHSWCEAPFSCCTSPISWVDGQWRNWLAAHQRYDKAGYPGPNCQVVHTDGYAASHTI